MVKIDILDSVPKQIFSSNNDGTQYPLRIRSDEEYLYLAYSVPVKNHTEWEGFREFTALCPRYIKADLRTFECLGLLQAEMGKRQDGKIIFCNHEWQMVKKVLSWFSTSMNLLPESWCWYIRVNISESNAELTRDKIEQKVLSHWLSRDILSSKQSYPKSVTYTKKSKRKTLSYYDYGSLIIECRKNLVSQIVKKMVSFVFQNILCYDNEQIRAFLRGMIAGEGCVEHDSLSNKFRVRISAAQKSDRLLLKECLKRLDIESYVYETQTDIVISKKENLLKLLELKLMTGSPKKYNKFLRVMKEYRGFAGLDQWKNSVQKPWNKMPESVSLKIRELVLQNPSCPVWKIAKKANVSISSVRRICNNSSQNLFK